jgi:hypothetical protein
VATYLKTFQALSYERLQGALCDLFGLRLSQGGLMNLLRRAQARFEGGQTSAVSALRRAEVVAADETGVRIEGSNAYHWVFCSPEAVVASCRADARGLGGPNDDGRTPPCALAVGPLRRPAGPRDRPSDLLGASGARRRLSG